MLARDHVQIAVFVEMADVAGPVPALAQSLGGEVRRTRDGKASAASLKTLEQAAREGKNVMPYLVECCRAYATLGEMADVFRDVFGEFKEPKIF